jgi:hypothetical protein
MKKYTEWTTKDGRKIPIKDMEDGHLLNAIRMLQCKASALQSRETASYFMLGEPQGEMAQDAYHAGMDELMDMEPLEYLETREDYTALTQEARKRKLTY